jgi:hypothetical protein
MSKGPGKTERLLLAAVLEQNGVLVRDAMGKHPSASEKQAMYRAAYSLERKGLIRLWWYDSRRLRWGGYPVLFAMPPDRLHPDRLHPEDNTDRDPFGRQFAIGRIVQSKP